MTDGESVTNQGTVRVIIQSFSGRLIISFCMPGIRCALGILCK